MLIITAHGALFKFKAFFYFIDGCLYSLQAYIYGLFIRVLIIYCFLVMTYSVLLFITT